MQSISATCEIYSPERLEYFIEQWTKAWDVSDSNSMFLAPNYVRTWLVIFGDSLRPSFYWCRAGGQTVGAFALTYKHRLYKRVPQRVLFLNFAGENGHDSIYIERNHVLTSKEASDAIYPELFKAVINFPQKWDLFSVPGCEEIAALTSAFDGVQMWEFDQRPAPFCQFSIDVATIPAEAIPVWMSSNTRQQLRRSIRYVEAKYGRLELRCITRSDQIQIALDRFKHLHLLSWGQSGEGGAMSTRNNEAFHRHLAGFGECLDRLEMLEVWAGPRLLGVLYVFVTRKCAQFYQSGFDYDDNDAAYRPGLLTHLLAIQHYRQKGYSIYDFMAGDSRYKTSLANSSRPMAWIEFVNERSVRMKLLGVARKIFRVSKLLLEKR